MVVTLVHMRMMYGNICTMMYGSEIMIVMIKILNICATCDSAMKAALWFHLLISRRLIKRFVEGL